MSDPARDARVTHGGRASVEAHREARERLYGTIPRRRVQEEYDKAVLTVSRINSWASDPEGVDDLDMLPYYEGQRDALHRLLEPEEVEANG